MGERKRLTPKQMRFVEQYVLNGGNATRAVEQAGYKSRGNVARVVGSENLTKPAIRAEVDAALRRYNITPDRWAKVLDRALDAESTIIIGPGQTEKKPDHATQIKAVDMAAKLADAYPHPTAAQHEHKHLHLQTSEPIEVMRFKVIHGRAPTNRELAELTGQPIPVEARACEMEEEEKGESRTDSVSQTNGSS